MSNYIITSIVPILDGGAEYRVTSPYGMRDNPVSGSGTQMHRGIDLTLWKGWSSLAYVCAAWDGVVKRVDYDASRGNYVLVDHGEGVVTHYYHLAMDTVKVRAGESVTAGQRIGYMGSTGAVTGAHLHFQIEIYGESVDPLPYITGVVPDAVGGDEMDNTPADWAADAVAWAVESGILYGDENGNYRLHEPCTREMMMVFLYRALGGGR